MSSKQTAPQTNGFLSSGHTTGSNFLSSGHTTGSNFLSSGHTTGFSALRGGASGASSGESLGASSARTVAGGPDSLLGMSGMEGLLQTGVTGMAAGWGMPTSFLEQMESQTGTVLDGLAGTASNMAANWGSQASAGLSAAAGGLGAAAGGGGLLPW